MIFQFRIYLHFFFDSISYLLIVLNLVDFFGLSCLPLDFFPQTASLKLTTSSLVCRRIGIELLLFLQKASLKLTTSTLLCHRIGIDLLLFPQTASLKLTTSTLNVADLVR